MPHGHRRERRRPDGPPPVASRIGPPRTARGYALLTRLLVDRVRAVPPAVLLHLDALAVVHLVLGGDVVAALARRALEGDGDALLVGLGHGLVSWPYLRILVTRPEPTVRPPSRMAKRRPSSMAIGAPSVTVMSVLSPGMHISTPSGSWIVPVTSVVRK